MADAEICAGAFVVRDGLVLALRRWNGVWLAPKGHVDPGETAVAAARREIMEEAGLTVEIIRPLGTTAYTHHEDGRPHRKRVEWFLAAAAPGEVRLEPGMFTAYQWLRRNQLDVFSFAPDRVLAAKALGLMPTVP